MFVQNILYLNLVFLTIYLYKPATETPEVTFMNSVFVDGCIVTYESGSVIKFDPIDNTITISRDYKDLDAILRLLEQGRYCE